MSRFTQEEYVEILRFPRKGRVPRRELLSFSERRNRLTRRLLDFPIVLVVFVLCVFFISAVLLVLDLSLDESYRKIIGVLTICILAVLLISLMLFKFLLTLNHARLILSRPSLSSAEFFKEFSDEGELSENIVEASLKVFGKIYNINPSLLRPNDKLRTLMILQGESPLQFEFILGVGDELGVCLSENEVDRIGQVLCKNANTIKQAILILTKEFNSKGFL